MPLRNGVVTVLQAGAETIFTGHAKTQGLRPDAIIGALPLGKTGWRRRRRLSSRHTVRNGGFRWGGFAGRTGGPVQVCARTLEGLGQSAHVAASGCWNRWGFGGAWAGWRLVSMSWLPGTRWQFRSWRRHSVDFSFWSVLSVNQMSLRESSVACRLLAMLSMHA